MEKIEEELKRNTKDILKNNINKAKLKTMLEYKINGAKIRARQLQYPNSEKETKDFYHQEAKINKQTLIDNIQKENNQLTFDQKEITCEIEKFYKRLYTSENPTIEDIDKFLDTYQPREQLNEEENAELQKPITIKEIDKAIKNMNRNKAPGIDGLPIEFYSKTNSSTFCKKY